VIPRRTKRGILVLAMLTAVTFWLSRSGGERRRQPIPGLDTRLDYALHEFEARYHDEAGRPALHVRAPTLTNDASSGIGLIENPRFDVLQDGKRWSMVAESATVTADREHVLLTGAVSMRRFESATTRSLEVNASEVVFDVTPRFAHSDRPVVIRDGSDTLEAVGFSIDMGNDSFHLDSRVRGRYVIQ
jgi:LPS export ABC transporter protein LptC